MGTAVYRHGSVVGPGRARADIVAASTVRTPWGDSDGLRERRLRPGPGTPREEVERNQRERLMAAMVAACEAKGYGEIVVADLVGLSGVSRSAFYRHFANREDCFLATSAEVVEAALAVVGSRYRRDRGWEERARDALRTFFSLLAGQPAAARLVLVESYAAGPGAVAEVEEATRAFEDLALQALAQLPGRKDIPAEMVRAMIGGLREVIQSRLRRHREAELVELAPTLLEAALAYRSPPTPLLGERRARASERSPSPAATNGHLDAAERIIAASTRIMGVRGYARTTLDEIVAEAAVSLSTFYECFEGKEAVLAAALDAGQARMFAAAAPAYRRGRGWPEAVRGAVDAIFRFLAAEPDFARLGMVEIYGAGRTALERRERTVARFARFLDPGFELAAQVESIAGELAVGSVLALVYEQVRAGPGGAHELPGLAPVASYILLAPFLGPESAWIAAGRNGRAGGRAPTRAPA